MIGSNGHRPGCRADHVTLECPPPSASRPPAAPVPAKAWIGPFELELGNVWRISARGLQRLEHPDTKEERIIAVKIQSLFGILGSQARSQKGVPAVDALNVAAWIVLTSGIKWKEFEILVALARRKALEEVDEVPPEEPVAG